MQISGTHQFTAPVELVWATLLDPAALAQALPGAEGLRQVGDNNYQAAMQVRIGPVQGRFEGKVEIVDLKPLESYRMRVAGQGAPGFLNGEGDVRLEVVDGGTKLHYTGDVQVGGRIAGVGQRLLDSTAKSLIRQGFRALDEQVQARLQPTPPAAPQRTALPAGADAPAPAVAPTPTPATSPTPAPDMARMAFEVAKDVAQDLASDYIPPAQQPKVFYFVLGALSMLLFVVLVRLVQRD